MFFVWDFPICVYFVYSIIPSAQMFFCALVQQAKNEIENLTADDWSFIDTAASRFQDEWTQYLGSTTLFMAKFFLGFEKNSIIKVCSIVQSFRSQTQTHLFHLPGSWRALLYAMACERSLVIPVRLPAN